MKELLPLIVIVGPTSVGKTDLGIMLAKKINGEVISGDSMQVYRHMNIGTAKPSDEEKGGIPHHLIDTINPDEEFNVAIFQKQVENLIQIINKRGSIPVLVGGTGLYVRSIIDHYDFTPPAGTSEKRDELQQMALRLGNEHLYRLLTEVDPISASKIHPNDTRRLIRALEVFYSHGKPLSDYQYNSDELEPKYRLAYYGLTLDREMLYKRIEHRVDVMISRGLVDEVKELIEMGYGLHNTSMQAIGYKEIVEYLSGHINLEAAVEKIKLNTRRFAKRQLTWFRRDKRIIWKNVESGKSVEEIANEIAAEVEGQFCIM